MTRYLLLCFALMLGAVLLVAERPAAALQAYDDCPANATQLAQSNQPVRCRCDAAATRRGTVWGDDIYTSDSSICRAALHAGVIDANGGLVTLDPEQGRQGYAGSRRNGVETLRFGAWSRSFRVLRGGDWPEGNQPGADLCPANARDVRTRQVFDCMCPAEATRAGAVWGTDIYTDDSSICRAALHAGAIQPRGGVVSVRGLTGRGSYEGSTRNGVTTSGYGAWESSFRFAGIGYENPDAVDRCPDNGVALRGTNRALQCRCAPEDTRAGAVWGSDVYSDDSRICRAALHAGVIGTDGGTVTVRPAEGRQSYAGSRRNGVETSNYGRWPGSYRFER